MASQHKLNCSPHTEAKNEAFRAKFLANNLAHKTAIFYPNISITTVMIENAINKIANHSAPGLDDICIEHFKFAHPSVIAILKSLFNIFLSLGEVPSDFGIGLVSPIPKFKGHKIKVEADDFRGITLNSIVSKKFENCILPSLNNLTTSKRQFGFKKGTSCTHALHQLKNTIQCFNKRGHTVNLGLIDIRKAFDKVSYWGILTLLQTKLVNPVIVDILAHWFSNSTAVVAWNNCISAPVHLSAGVRQGGILSPLLFSAFIDGLLIDLEKSKLGCNLNGICLNSLLYADDLLLLSPTISDLQLLVERANSILNDLDLQINFNKSCCLRVGTRFSKNCGLLKINNEPLVWVQEAKYLGLTISASSHFRCNWRPVKRQFFSAVNRILASLGSNPNFNVVLSLFQAACVPILTYGLSALALTLSAELHGFSFAYNNLFHKLFKTNNKNIIEQCQFYCSILLFTHTIF